jgi:hypothetical protein
MDARLAQPEVGDPHVPLQVQQDVLRLYVSVEDVVRVELFDAQQDLQEVEFGCLLIKPFLLLYVGEQLASRAVLHHEDDVVPALEGVVQGHEERMPDFYHDVPLVDHDDLTFALR